jgi:hypothetical protein
MGRAERVTTREASADHRTVVPRLCPLRISSRAGWMPIQDKTVQTLEAAHRQSSPALCASDQTLSRVQSGGGVGGLLAVAGRITCKDARLCQAFVCAWSPTCAVRHTASHGAWHMAIEHASAFLWAASARRRRGPRRAHAPQGRRQPAISSQDPGPASAARWARAPPPPALSRRSARARHVLSPSQTHHRLILGCPARLGPAARGSP